MPSIRTYWFKNLLAYGLRCLVPCIFLLHFSSSRASLSGDPRRTFLALPVALSLMLILDALYTHVLLRQDRRLSLGLPLRSARFIRGTHLRLFLYTLLFLGDWLGSQLFSLFPPSHLLFWLLFSFEVLSWLFAFFQFSLELHWLHLLKQKGLPAHFLFLLFPYSQAHCVHVPFFEHFFEPANLQQVACYREEEYELDPVSFEAKALRAWADLEKFRASEESLVSFIRKKAEEMRARVVAPDLDLLLPLKWEDPETMILRPHSCSARCGAYRWAVGDPEDLALGFHLCIPLHAPVQDLRMILFNSTPYSLYSIEYKPKENTKEIFHLLYKANIPVTLEGEVSESCLARLALDAEIPFYSSNLHRASSVHDCLILEQLGKGASYERALSFSVLHFFQFHATGHAPAYALMSDSSYAELLPSEGETPEALFRFYSVSNPLHLAEVLVFAQKRKKLLNLFYRGDYSSFSVRIRSFWHARFHKIRT